MKPLRTLLAMTAFLIPTTVLTTDTVEMNGYWWEGTTPSFKLGWVSGFAKAMDSAGTLQLATCASNMPLYQKEFPGVDSKIIMQKMCLSNDNLDYDGIRMGQFVDGIDAFYKDYRNKQLEAGWAIEYTRDSIKGKPAHELDSEVILWRRCTAADKGHPMPRSDADAAIVGRACTPDAKQ